MSTKIPILTVYDQDGNQIQVPAIQGKSPYVGHNNNWFVGSKDTGARAVSGIEETVTGTSFISVKDSEDDVLYGLRLLGKSTQNGIPSPTAPIDIVDVGSNVGAITANATGTNLVDFTTLEKTYTGYGQGVRNIAAAKSLISLLKNNIGKTFYYTADITAGTPGIVPPGSIIVYGETVDIKILRIEPGVPFVVPEAIVSADIIYLYGATVGETMTISNMQINAGDTKLPYEPYRGSSVTVSTLNGLPGIPVPSDGNYVDANGQQWICDEIDFKRGVLVQNILKYVFTGEESWQSYQNPSYNNTYRYRIRTMQGIQGVVDVYKVNILCSHFLYGGYVSEDQLTGIGVSEANYVYLRFDGENDTITTVDELKAFMLEQYTNGTPVYILARRDIPIETPLTNDELKAYRTLLSHSPETNIFTDVDVNMEVSYSVNVKSYIDKKIAEGGTV